MNGDDPFVGTWKLNPAKSSFDPNHRPASATMHWERDSQGYLMTAEGINNNGQAVRERPQRFIPDGEDRPAPDAPGVTAIATRPAPNVIQVEAKSAGRVVGRASYSVSEDGTTLTARVSGADAQQQSFDTVVVFDRQ